MKLFNISILLLLLVFIAVGCSTQSATNQNGCTAVSSLQIAEEIAVEKLGKDMKERYHVILDEGEDLYYFTYSYNLLLGTKMPEGVIKNLYFAINKRDCQVYGDITTE